MRALFAVLFLAIFAFANGEQDKKPEMPLDEMGLDFSMCQKKVLESSFVVGSSRAFVIKNGEAIIASKTTPADVNILKSDSFLGLYLIEAKRDVKPMELDAEYENKELAIVDKNEYRQGKVLDIGSPLLQKGLFSQKSGYGSAVVSICYRLHGLGVDGSSIISAKYIKNFLDREPVSYAQFGVETMYKDGHALVKKSDPFYTGNGLLEDDKIYEIDGMKFENIRDFEESYIYKKIGSTINIGFMRNGKKYSTTAVLEPLGLYRDTFLSRLGVEMDGSLRITKNSSTLPGLKWLKSGDKIMRIQQIPVSSKAKLDSLFSKITDPIVSVLLERDGFQFFVEIPMSRAAR